MEKIGLDLYVLNLNIRYALRRTFASYLMNQTFEPLQIGEISKVLGHKNIKTTIIYLYDIVDLSGFVKMRKAITNMNR